MDDALQKAVDISIGAVIAAREALDKLGGEWTPRGGARESPADRRDQPDTQNPDLWPAEPHRQPRGPAWPRLLPGAGGPRSRRPRRPYARRGLLASAGTSRTAVPPGSRADFSQRG